LSKSILITGVAGFLGSHLAEALLALGHHVTGIDNFDPFYPENIKRENLTVCLQHPRFHFVSLDIRDSKGLDELKQDFDLLIHIAAKAGVLPSLQNPQEYVSVNIGGTASLLEFMRKRKIQKYLFASSSSIYGNSKQIPFTEDQVVDQPISPYAFTKRSAELMNSTYHHLYGIDCINLRLFTLYGPRQRPDLSIHKFVKRIENGQNVEMYGDGSTARDYTHVSDVVNGFLLAMDYLFQHNEVFDIVNIGNNSPVQLRELIRLSFKVMGQPEKIEQKPVQPGDVDITFASIEKANRLFGYSPKISFEEGLQDFANWYRSR
jgi:nucleoside-diphosphate-sugar epimerase